MKGSPLRRIALNARCLGVIVSAGLIQPNRPVRTIRAARAMRQLGPIAGAIVAGAGRDPDFVGLVDEIGTLSLGALDRRSNALARAWQRLGVDHRSVIGLLARNHRGVIDTMAAAGKLGATVVPLNTGSGRRQLTEVLRREHVSVLVHDAEFTDLAATVADAMPRFLCRTEDSVATFGIDTLDDLIAATDDRPLPAPPRPGGIILLTSGTGGTPKGTPRAIANPLAVAQFLDRIPLRAGGCTAIPAPLHHGTGLAQLIMTLALGSTVVLTRRFEPRDLLRAVERHRATAVVLVPTMLRRLVDAREHDDSHDLSSVRVLLVSGAPLPPRLAQRALDAFGDVLHNMYGGTETSVVAVAMPADLRHDPATVGRPPIGCEIALFDDAERRIDGPGVTGRIHVDSILAFDGYTDGQRRHTIDGMLSTGDLGHFDATGRLFVDGRADDMIISGAENVYPIEIENLLLEHPDVADAAVVGVPDDEFGQRVVAHVVPRAGATPDEQRLKDYVRSTLARYKVPRQVSFTDELPRNAAGKLMRHLLPHPDTERSRS